MSLSEEKCRRLICYPECTDEEAENRVLELRQLEIDSICFTGQKRVLNIPVLGKGCVGLVVVAFRGREKVALKIRRTDANRSTMQHEAEMLRRANEVDVGPRLLGASDNFLVMEYIEGFLLPEWLGSTEGGDTRKTLSLILRRVLEQVWRLDMGGLDHGELSNASKHIIVAEDKVPYLVDFETASVSRRVSNVTSLCQYLFVGGKISHLFRAKLDFDIEELIGALRIYKAVRSRRNFEAILRKCRI